MRPASGDDLRVESVAGVAGPPAPHDPTGTDVALRVAAVARGAVPVARRRRVFAPDPEDLPWSPAEPSVRDPQVAGTVLSAIVARRGWQRQLAVMSLLPRWAEFVGEVNAAHTTPEKYNAGTLVIRAESTTWATALRTMGPLLLQRFNQLLGPGTVTQLKILGPQAPSWKKGKRSVPGRGPRDTYG